MSQEDLNSFLAVAEDLKVKGLTQNAGGGGGKSKTNDTQSVSSAAISTKLMDGSNSELTNRTKSALMAGGSEGPGAGVNVVNIFDAIHFLVCSKWSVLIQHGQAFWYLY